MQSINKLHPKTKIIILIAIALILFLFLTLAPKDSEIINVEDNEYYDPGSGETVFNPSDRDPESVGSLTKDIVHLGTSSLLDVGMSMDQIDLYKQAVTNYSESKNSYVDEVSINISTIETDSSHEKGYYNTINFELTINRQDVYDAEINLSGISTIEFNIQDKAGNLIYTSGDILVEDAI